MNTSDHQAACNQALARIIGRNMRSSSSKALVSEILKEAVSSWAEGSTFRKRLAAPVLWAASKIGRPGSNGLNRGMAADVGVLLTSLARKVNAERAAKEPGQSEKPGESIEAFLRNTDFGEILEMIEGSDPHVIEGIRVFNEQLWKYPAKVGALTVAANALLNTSIKAASEALKPIDEQFSPDLLADILLSTVRELKGANVAMLVNTIFELIRRVHTGSLRLGSGGRTLFQTYLTALLNDCLPVMKPELLKKARVALAQDGEAYANSMSEALKSNPAILLSVLSTIGAVRSSRSRAVNRKLRAVLEMDQSDLNAAVSESVSDLDTYGIAELINTTLSLLESIHEARPDIVSSLAGGIADSVDTERLRRTCEWLIPDLVDALRPLAPAVMPEIIKGLKDLAGSHDMAGAPIFAAAGGER